MSDTGGDQDLDLEIGLTQIITASILVHMDGRCRFIQHSRDREMWTITDTWIDRSRVAWCVTQNEVCVYLPKPKGVQQ